MGTPIADLNALKRKSRSSGETSLPWHKSERVLILRK